MHLAGDGAIASDLAEVVDAAGIVQRPAGLGVDEGIEVGHRRARVEEGVVGRIIGSVSHADHLGAGVDAGGSSVISTQVAQVGERVRCNCQGGAGREAHRKQPRRCRDERGTIQCLYLGYPLVEKRDP